MALLSSSASETMQQIGFFKIVSSQHAPLKKIIKIQIFKI